MHDRQVGLLAFENATDVNADLTKSVREAGTVAHQAAGRREFAPLVDRGHSVTGGQGDELFASAEEERVRGDEERSDPLFDPTYRKIEGMESGPVWTKLFVVGLISR